MWGFDLIKLLVIRSVTNVSDTPSPNYSNPSSYHHHHHILNTSFRQILSIQTSGFKKAAVYLPSFCRNPQCWLFDILCLDFVVNNETLLSRFPGGVLRFRTSRNSSRSGFARPHSSSQREYPDLKLHLQRVCQPRSCWTTLRVRPTLYKSSINYRLTEYYCDCSKDGTPTLLLMDLEITTRNLKNGSPLAVSIDTTPPKGIYSVASLPRMNLNGRMVKVEGEKEVCLWRELGLLIIGERCAWVLLDLSSRRDRMDT
jgi:hypothetical protein